LAVAGAAAAGALGEGAAAVVAGALESWQAPKASAMAAAALNRERNLSQDAFIACS